MDESLEREQYEESNATEPPGACSHPIEDLVFNADADARPNGDRMATIQLKCGRCDLPYHFAGFEQGMSFRKAMTDDTGTKLHCPIFPGPIHTASPVQVFEYTPNEARAMRERAELAELEEKQARRNEQ